VNLSSISPGESSHERKDEEQFNQEEINRFRKERGNGKLYRVQE